jgi:hypothetical protein
MKELPFDPYDFFGYIASGLVLVVLAQLILRLTNRLPTGVGESRKGEAILYS